MNFIIVIDDKANKRTKNLNLNSGWIFCYYKKFIKLPQNPITSNSK